MEEFYDDEEEEHQNEDKSVETKNEEAEDEEEEEEEEEEENEPQLKYQRLKGSIEKILAEENGKNFISALAVGDRFLALGTLLGYLYILDFEGNSNTEQIYKPHSNPINDISLDANNEYIATCSDDGKVVIFSLYGKERLEYKYDRPVSSVALDPDYSKKKDRPFCIGGKSAKLVLTKKGWFGANNETVLHTGEGDIHTIRWHRQYIAWANELGVKIVDISTQTKIAYIRRPANAPRADLFRCSMVWVDHQSFPQFNRQPMGKNEHYHTLIIAWGQTVNIVTIKETQVTNLSLSGAQVTASAAASGLPPNTTTRKFSSFVATGFKVDFFICGVAPYGENLLILAFDEEEQFILSPPRGYKAPIPELRMYSITGEEKTIDALPIKDYEQNSNFNYRFEFSSLDSVYYIVSTRDVLITKDRDIDDHIKWLLSKSKFPDALQCIQQNEATSKQYSIEKIGMEYLNSLFKKQEFKLAGSIVSKIAKNNVALWEKLIYEFISKKHFGAIVPYIPRDNPRLSDTKFYEMQLNYYLLHDKKMFLEALQTWPSDLYKCSAIITVVMDTLKRTDQNDQETQTILFESLLALYMNEKQYEKALKIYFKLKKPDVFEFIKNYDLFSRIQDTIVSLLEFDEVRALNLLVENTDKILVDQVVDQLQTRRILLHKYLHQLFLKNEMQSQKYHLKQVELYCEFEVSELLKFLRESQSYNIEKALHICEKYLDKYEDGTDDKKQLYRCIVHLLGRMGNTNDALDLIMDKLKDVSYAIEFVETQRDAELWSLLVKHSLQDSEFISGLLVHISAHYAEHIDPLGLIKQIPDSLKIPGLKYKLTNIITDYSLQKTLQKGCVDILKNDIKELSQNLYKSQRKGVRIAANKQCVICGQYLRNTSKDESIAFFCGHTYHIHCFTDVFFRGQQLKAKEETTSSKASTTAASPLLPKHVELFKSNEQVHCIVCHKKEQQQPLQTSGALGELEDSATTPTETRATQGKKGKKKK